MNNFVLFCRDFIRGVLACGGMVGVLVVVFFIGNATKSVLPSSFANDFRYQNQSIARGKLI